MKFVREKLELPDGFEMAKEKFISGELPVREAAKLCGINYGTFYKNVKILYKNRLK